MKDFFEIAGAILLSVCLAVVGFVGFIAISIISIVIGTAVVWFPVLVIIFAISKLLM